MHISSNPFSKPPLHPIFSYQSFKSQQSPKQYILNLIQLILIKQKLPHSPLLCMNQLNDILNQLKIPLKNKQIHEVYLFSTYQKFNEKDTKKKLNAMVNQEKNKIDVIALAEWICGKIQNGDIKVRSNMNNGNNNNTNHNSNNNKSKPLRPFSHPTPKPTSLHPLQKLPPLRGTYSQKLQQQLKCLIQIFQKMQYQRQNSGLIPINQNQQDDIQIPNMSIPYDPQLYSLNNNLSKLRIKAEDRLARIIELAKNDKRIRVKLEQAIEKFQRQRIEANQKVGRIGAMKAYKRVIEKKKQEIKKIKNLKLGEEENLVKATHLHALLNLPEIKSNKIIY